MERVFTQRETQFGDGRFLRQQSVNNGNGTGRSVTDIWNPNGTQIHNTSIDRGNTIYNQKIITLPDGRRIIQKSVRPDYDDNNRHYVENRHHGQYGHNRHHGFNNWFNRDGNSWFNRDGNSWFNRGRNDFGYDPIGERIGRDGFDIGRPDKDVRHMRKLEMGLNLGGRILDFFGSFNNR